MEKYALGDRLVLHVEGTVTNLHESYAEVSTGDSFGTWTVEYDDPDWRLLGADDTVSIDIDNDLIADLVGVTVKEYIRRHDIPLPRSDRELQLESALLELQRTAYTIYAVAPLNEKQDEEMGALLDAHNDEIRRLQAMP